MKKIHFKGIKQNRKETPEQKKKRIQQEFLNNYNNYQSRKNDSEILSEIKKQLGL